MSGPNLTTFSKVDVDKMDLDEYPELKEEPPKEQGGPGGMGDMQGMMGMGGMPGMGDMQDMMGGGMGMDGMHGMPGMGATDFDEWKLSAIEKSDVGKTFDCSRGDKKARPRHGGHRRAPPTHAPSKPVGRARR